MASTRDHRSYAFVAQSQPESQDLGDEVLTSQETLQCQNDKQRPDTNPDACLAGLPRELRDMISELAVYHTESDGVIAPIPSNKQCYAYKKSSITLIAGQRVTARRGTVSGVNAPIPKQSVDRCRDQSFAQKVARAEKLASSTNAKHGHICSLSCLLQPALTQVSRAFRAEALPIFYATNHFHFELDNFLVCDSRYDFDNVIGPPDWWRAVGDTNLRLIRHLSLVGHWAILEKLSHDPDNEAEPSLVHCTAMVIYLQDGATRAHRSIDAVKVESSRAMAVEHRRSNDIPRFLSWYEVDKNASNVLMAPFIQKLQTSGLHVQALECMIAYMEETSSCVLRDYSALDCAVPAAAVVRASIEAKIQIMEALRRRKKWDPELLCDRAPEVFPKRPLRSFNLLSRGSGAVGT